MKWIFTGIAMLLWHSIVFSQLTNVRQLEFESDDGYFQEEVFPFGKTGLLLVAQKRDKDRRTKQWRYDLFNTSLEAQNSREIATDRKFWCWKTASDAQNLHQLFRQTRKKNNNFALISIGVPGLTKYRLEGSLPPKARLKEMKAFDNRVYVTVSIEGKPFLLLLDQQSGHQELLGIKPNQQPKNGKLEWLGLQILEQDGDVLAYLKEVRDSRQYDTWVIRLASDGRRLSAHCLTANTDRNLLGLSGSRIATNLYAFAGTYADGLITEAEGLFFGRLTDQGPDSLRFYHFVDSLQHFLSYLPEEDRERLLRKKARHEERGKEFYYSYRVANHEVRSETDGLLYIGEIYRPTYNTTTCPDGSTSEEFAGYEYTHAIIARFDAEGNLLWDQNLELLPRDRPKEVRTLVATVADDSPTLPLLFANGDELAAKTLDRQGLAWQDDVAYQLYPIDPSDELQRAEAGVVHWYDSFFIAHGYQRLKNQADPELKRRRWIYFLSKMEYDR